MTHLKLSFKINLTVQNITNYTYSMKRIFYMILMVSIQTKKSIMKKKHMEHHSMKIIH